MEVAVQITTKQIADFLRFCPSAKDSRKFVVLLLEDMDPDSYAEVAEFVQRNPTDNMIVCPRCTRRNYAWKCETTQRCWACGGVLK